MPKLAASSVQEKSKSTRKRSLSETKRWEKAKKEAIFKAKRAI